MKKVGRATNQLRYIFPHTIETIQNERAQLDPSVGCATFAAIKLNVSTRMNPINLKFTGTFQDKASKENIHARSPLSNPLIVITNESQWGDAAQKLFAKEAFGGQVSLQSLL